MSGHTPLGLAVRFLLPSLLCVVALAAGTGLALTSLVTRAAREAEWEHAVAVARHAITQARLAEYVHASPAARARWDPQLSEMFVGLGDMLRVKVWDAGHEVLWSDRPEMIGRREPDDPDLAAALRGGVRVNINRPAKAEHAVGHDELRHAVVAEIYVPIGPSGGGPPVGVLEFYKVPGRFLDTAMAGRRLLWGISISGGILLLLSLLPIAHRLYRSQEAAHREHRQQSLERLLEASRDLARLQPLESLASSVVRSLAGLVGAESTALWLADGPAERLATSHGDDGGGPWPATAEALGPGRPGLLRLTVTAGDRVLGTLAARTRRRAAFTAEDLTTARAFVAHAAVALDNARLFQQAHERTERLRMLSAVTRAISSTLDSDQVSASVAAAAATLLGAKLVHVWETDASGETMRRRHSFSLEPGFQDPFEPGLGVLRRGQGLAGLVLETREPAYVADIQQDPRWLAPEAARAGGLHAVAGVPLIAGQRVVGILSILFSEVRDFTEDERDVVRLLADQSAIAMEHSRLFDELRRSYQDLRDTQDQLAQAHRMEALGRLAGGVAHDFNNILTAIVGWGELLGDRLPAAGARHEVDQILRSADRARELVRQLLAFSRRQILQPRVLDLNELIAGMGGLLRRVIGEDVELDIRLAGEPATVRADPTQLQQVVMNLVVNARDAMPRGGRVTLETAVDPAPARAARSVVLRVSDTGTGMDPATMARIFEPFFTTKPEGKGSGLGLAMVYGIVRQSDGDIAVDSAPGQGTVFTIRLPRIAGAAETPRPDAARAAARGGEETILVVEDDAAVRHLTVTILERAGYRVLEAASGAEALATSRAHGGPIHLLLSDVVMPGMSGPELASTLAAERPGLRVVFVSGHVGDALERYEPAGERLRVVPKPFTSDTLLREVRERLDAV